MISKNKKTPKKSPRTTPFSKRFVIIFISALIVRLFYLHESSDNPFFSTPLSDSATYHLLAEKLLNGKMDWKFFFQGTFYPLFLSFVYAIFGPSIVAVKVIQALIGAATAALTERLGTRIGGNAAGWISGGITAFYAPLIFFDGELLAAGWATFFAVLLLLSFSKILETPSPLRFFLLGIQGGLSVLTRPVFLPFFAFSLIWTFWALREKKQKSNARMIAGCAVGFLLITSPIALLNNNLTDHLSFLPSSGGLNFHIGNNPDICETLTIRPGAKWRELVNEPVKHGYIFGADKEKFYTEKFIEYALGDPLGYLKGLGLKALRFVNGREIPRNQDLYLQHKWSAVMTAGVWKIGRFGFPFSLLFALAVIGLFFKPMKIPVPVYLFSLLYSLSIVAVFVTARYRIPMIPAAAIFAALGAKSLFDAVRSRAFARLAKVLTTAFAALLLSVAPPAFCEEKINLEAEMYFLGASFYVQKNEIDRALSWYKKASALNPSNAEALEMQGLVLSQKGRLRESVQAFYASLRLRPDAVNTHFFLGKTLTQAGQYKEAQPHLTRVSTQRPNSGPAHFYLGICLANQGKTESAYEHLKKAVRLMPKDKKAKQTLKKIERKLSFSLP